MIYILMVLILMYCIKRVIFHIIWKEVTAGKIVRTPDGYLKNEIDKDRRIFMRRSKCH